MITSILEDSNSPTQQRQRATKWNTINVEIMDNDEKMIPVKIDYEWTPYYGVGHEVTIWNFDYSTPVKYVMSERDFCEAVKDVIREEERTTVSFF